MRILVLVVVGSGSAAQNACLKHMHETHWTRNWPENEEARASIRYVYSDDGSTRIFMSGQTDLVLPPHTPTTLAMILRALGEETINRFDFVVRTTVNTWLHYDDLLKHIQKLPKTRTASGSMPGVDLVNENHTIVTRDVAFEILQADELVTRDTDSEEVTLSKWLLQRNIFVASAARIDLVFSRDVLLRGNIQNAFAVRLFHFNRWLDVDLFHELVTTYSPLISTADSIKKILKNRP